MTAAITLTIEPGQDASTLTSHLAQFAQENDLPAKTAFAVELVLEELVTNVVKHSGKPGGATIEVMLDRDGNAIKGAVRDDAEAYDPLARDPVDINASLDERGIGGLGVHLVRSMTDQLAYQFSDGHNVLTFTINIEKDTP